MIADYGAALWTGLLFGIGAPPATVYVALLLDDASPGWDGTTLASIEPTDTAYARLAVAAPAGWTQDSVAGFVTNANDLTYPVPLADWGTTPGWALLDAATGGNLIAAGEWLEPVFVYAGVAPTVAAGTLAIALSDLQPPITET